MASKRIRVTQVLEACVGGTRKHVLDLCLGLDPDRFQLSAVLSPIRDHDFPATVRLLEDAGVRVVSLPLRRTMNPLELMGAVARLCPILADLRPDILHAHSSVAGFVGRIAARRTGVPRIVYTPHGFPFLMDAPWPVKSALLAVERRLGRQTDCTVAVCESERDIALRCRVASPESCLCIPNGILFAEPPRVDRAQVRRQLGLPPDCPLLLSVGDLRRQKGHDAAIRAMPRVLERFADAHLLIAGEGDLRTPLEQFAARLGVGERVHLPGQRDDVPRLLAACDLLCQSSRWEGCPYALIEAAAAGCALVATDIPGNSDVVRQGQTGWLVRLGDDAALAGALVEALGDESARRQRGQAAAAFVRQRHDLDNMLRDTAGLYQALAAG